MTLSTAATLWSRRRAEDFFSFRYAHRSLICA